MNDDKREKDEQERRAHDPSDSEMVVGQLPVMFGGRAAAQLSKLPRPWSAIIRDRLQLLSCGVNLEHSDEPKDPSRTLPSVRRLVGNLAGYYRLRVGDYRVIFKLHDGAIWVCSVAHRREVYRDQGRKKR